MRRRLRVHVCLTLLTCLSLVGVSTMAHAQSGPGCPEATSKRCQLLMPAMYFT
ncbi:MAG: hypothetical protein WC007_06435 [Pelobacteraceae bacterium]